MSSKLIRLPIPIRYYYGIGQRLTSTCERCGHQDTLDLEFILEQHGPKVTTVDLRCALYCAICNSDRPFISLSGRRGDAFR